MMDVDEKKRALAVTLSLCGQTGAKAVEIDVEKLSDKNGMQTLIGEWDKILYIHVFLQIPNDVLSFKLLNSAGLSEADRQLALIAAKDLKFLLIKSALKQIFIGSSHSDSFVGGSHTRVK